MITGASSAEAASMLIDAGQGIQQQSRLHAFLLNLLGVKQIAVLVNKMDLVDFSEARFADIAREYSDVSGLAWYQGELHYPAGGARWRQHRRADPRVCAWYQGPTLVDALDSFAPAAPLGRAAFAPANPGHLQIR